MGFSKIRQRPFFEKIPPFYIFLLSISPILISLIVHMTALYFSGQYSWSFSIDEVDEKESVPAVIVMDGKKDDGLKFQGTDHLDSFRAEDKMAYPLPEVDYRPVTPDVEFYPDANVSDELDIISIEAAAVDHQWTNPSTGRQPLHTGPEKFVGSFSRHIQVLREGGLDVVFVFDATASMMSFLKNVKLKIENLAGAFKKLVPTCRIGLIAYRDTDEESLFVTKIHPLTYGTTSLKRFLKDIDAKGGGDYEEAIGEALKLAITGMKWNQKSKKFILLIGDAPPHESDLKHSITLVKRFREEMGGTLAALDTRVPEFEAIEEAEAHFPTHIRDLSKDAYRTEKGGQSVMHEFQMFTQAGGGESARLVNEEKVVRKMLLLIFGEKWEMYLNEFMKQL